ncbi:MAG: hypothetical protein KF775_14440 [Cyclobacteriaceae bacterium]|nr:hypothetical protein [Cyclobacteriaceae bacterium]
MTCESEKISYIYHPSSKVINLKEELILNERNVQYLNDSIIRLEVDGAYDEVRILQVVELKEDTYYFFNSIFGIRSYCLSKKHLKYFEIPGMIINVNPVLNVNKLNLLNIISDNSALSITNVLSNFYVLSESFELVKGIHIPRNFSLALVVHAQQPIFIVRISNTRLTNSYPGK